LQQDGIFGHKMAENLYI